MKSTIQVCKEQPLQQVEKQALDHPWDAYDDSHEEDNEQCFPCKTQGFKNIGIKNQKQRETSGRTAEMIHSHFRLPKKNRESTDQ